MEIEEFNKTSFGAGMIAKYKGCEYPVVSVNFEESLFGLGDINVDDDDLIWVRCENVDLINNR